MTHYWLSTKSPPAMFRLEYQTPELAALLVEARGVDAAILAQEASVSAPCIRAYQRKLGVRKITSKATRSAQGDTK